MPVTRRAARPAKTQPTATQKKPRRAKAQLPGEKAIKGTDRTVGVAARKVGRAAAMPLAPRAIDRRKHFPESDAVQAPE
jgi:hypothetical protein